jgi:hypothetical protein
MSKRPKEDVQKFRDKIVRLFSLLHAMALEVISDEAVQDFRIIDIESIPDRYLQELLSKDPRSRVDVVYQWICTCIMTSSGNGLLTVPPPILTRVFQEMETGMIEYNQVLQVINIPFPFPYAQVALFMIWFYMGFTPFIMIAWTSSPLTAGLFTFLSTSCLLGLEMISAELDQPFGDDANDLPCAVFQDELNHSLMLLVEDGADLEFELVYDYNQGTSLLSSPRCLQDAVNARNIVRSDSLSEEMDHNGQKTPTIRESDDLAGKTEPAQKSDLLRACDEDVLKLAIAQRMSTTPFKDNAGDPSLFIQRPPGALGDEVALPGGSGDKLDPALKTEVSCF